MNQSVDAKIRDGIVHAEVGLSIDDLIGGGIVSIDPIVTYTRGDQCIGGIAQCYPELFRRRGALHFVGFNRAVDADLARRLAEQLALLEGELVDNRFVVLANDEYEAVLLGDLGLATFVSTHVIFTDEGVFRPYPPPAAPARRFAAVYNARFETYKRHELARGIDSLMLVYAINGGGVALPVMQQLLPHAYFANHEIGGGSYRWLGLEAIAELFGACSVGLCLSASEGAMRAAMEYLMCGLMVVSTESVGGRSRYLAPPYARIVSGDAASVARAANELAAAPLSKQAIRDHIGRIISFERLNFISAANRVAKAHLGIDGLFKTVEPFMRCANEWRRASEVVAPLKTAAGCPPTCTGSGRNRPWRRRRNSG
jgi:glycosyltransferase involved in cell wall biosynthesis